MIRKQLRKRIPTECISWRWHGNLGDDMIFAAQEAMFSDFLNLGQYIPNPEALIIGGGTFVPKFPHHPDLVKLSQQLPTAFFGTGIGDPLFWGTDHIPSWLEILRNSQFIGVRGPLSKKRLEDWGADKNQIQWIGDPALYFAQEIGNQKDFQGKIGVNVGITYGWLYGSNELSVFSTIIKLLKILSKEDWDITLLCAWQPDELAIELVKNNIPRSTVVHWHDDYSKALKSVEEFDIIICEKLHVGVVAACRGIPFIALNYRSKVMDFCQSIGWEDFCVSTENLDIDLLFELIGKIASAKSEYAAKLSYNALNVKKKLLESVQPTLAGLGYNP